MMCTLGVQEPDSFAASVSLEPGNMASRSTIDVSTCAQMLRAVTKELNEDQHLSPSLETVSIAFAHFFLAIASVTSRLNSSTLEAALPQVWEGCRGDQVRTAARQLSLSYSHLKNMEKPFVSGAKTHPKLTPVLLALRKWRLSGCGDKSPQDLKRGNAALTRKSSSSSVLGQGQSSSIPTQPPQSSSSVLGQGQSSSSSTLPPQSSAYPSAACSVLSLYGLKQEEIPPSVMEKLAVDDDDQVDDDDKQSSVHSISSDADGRVLEKVQGSAIPDSSNEPAPAEVGYVDMSKMKYVCLMSDGSRQEHDITPGPKRFCICKLGMGENSRVAETEVPNDVLQLAQGKQVSAKKMPTKKRPAAAAATATAAPPPMKRPATAKARAVPDDDSEDEQSSDSVRIVEQDRENMQSSVGSSSGLQADGSSQQADGSSQKPPPKHDCNMAELVPMYYSSSNSAALRVPGGKQVLNLSGQWCRDIAKKEHVLATIKQVKQKIVDDGFTIADAKAWGQQKLAECVAALRKEALLLACLPSKRT